MGNQNEGQMKKGEEEREKVIIRENPILEENLRVYPDDAPNKSYAEKVSEIPRKKPAIQKTIKKLQQDPLEPMPREQRGRQFPPFFISKRKMHYMGEWKDGEPHGFGEMIFNNGTYYRGPFSKGNPDGDEGYFVFTDGSYKRGQIRNGKLNGQGTYVTQVRGFKELQQQELQKYEFRYTGKWQNDKPHGEGVEKYPDGSEYRGDFVKGVKHGKNCTLKWPNGKQFRGEFVNGVIQGQGVLKMDKGKGEFRGTFKNGMKAEAKGKKMKTQQGIYEGPFKHGKMEGKGKFTWEDKRVYEGQFVNGKLQGKGKITFKSGMVIEGKWKNGKNISVVKVENEKTKNVIEDIEREQTDD